MSIPQAEAIALRPPVLLLILIATVGPVALNIFMPSMPGMQAVFGVDYATVQLTLTFYLVAMAISQVVFGPLSDRYGRRPLLLIGLVLFVVGSALAAFAPTIELLIAARMIQGIGGASGLVLTRAIIRDCYDRSKSASMIGYVTMGMVVGPMLAPYFGGVLDEHYGWQSSFIALIILGSAIFAVTYLAMRETNTSRTAGAGFGPLFEGARILFASPAFWAYAAVLSFASASFFAFLAAAPYIAVDLMGLPPRVYGQYFPLGAIGYMTGNFLSGRYSERFGPNRMIKVGCLIGLVAAAGLIFSAVLGIMHPLSLFLPMMFTALSNGLVLPNATANIVSIRPDHAGAAAGVSGALQLLVGAAATVFVGAIQDDTQLPMALVMSTALLISFAGAIVGRPLLRREGVV